MRSSRSTSLRKIVLHASEVLPDNIKRHRVPKEQCKMAAFRGGADGVILSRKYSEMKLDNLRSAGDALKATNLA